MEERVGESAVEASCFEESVTPLFSINVDLRMVVLAKFAFLVVAG